MFCCIKKLVIKYLFFSAFFLFNVSVSWTSLDKVRSGAFDQHFDDSYPLKNKKDNTRTPITIYISGNITPSNLTPNSVAVNHIEDTDFMQKDKYGCGDECCFKPCFWKCKEGQELQKWLLEKKHLEESTTHFFEKGNFEVRN